MADIENGHKAGVFYGHGLYDVNDDKTIPFSGAIIAYEKFLAGELKGEQGPEGPQGPVGPGGGEPGPAGPQGEQGPQGEVGPQGPQGPAGKDGLDGGIGPQGIQGEQGPAGPQGVEGPRGPVGPAGLEWMGTWDVSISYTKNNSVGYQGASYYSVFEGDNLGNLPTDETYWALLASQGAEGPQGPVGPVGPQGIRGPQGPAGSQGPAGPQGLKGDKGDTGPAGRDAENGQSVFTTKGMCPGVDVKSHTTLLPNSPGVSIGLRGTTSANFEIVISNTSGKSVTLRSEAVYTDSTSVKKVSGVNTYANNATARIFQYTWGAAQNRSFRFIIYDVTNSQYYEGFVYTPSSGTETTATQVPAIIAVKSL